MSVGGKVFETKLNVLLGRMLSKEIGLRATSEYISRKNRPDVIVYVNGLRVVIEGSYSRADAENDVRKRIEEGIGDLGLALFYREHFPQNLPDSQLEEKLRNSIFEVRLIVPEDISETLLRYFTSKKITSKWVTEWMEAKIADLATILSEATQFVIREEDINQSIKEINEKINSFVQKLKSVDPAKHVAKGLYDVFYKLYGLSVGDHEEIDELIYSKAALTILLSATFYQSMYAVLGLNSISSLCRRYGYRLGLKKAFEDILKIDYEPIYDLALRVVETIPDTVDLKEIVELAEKCSSKRTLLKRDFSGKIYHRIVGDWAIRKNFATYFTTVPAAYLLAYLTVFTRTGVFKDFERAKVGDLACGSGTLLVAAYSALRDLYIYSKVKDGEINLGDFHKRTLEEDMWGIDALRYAVQIASTNLALQEPSIQINHMNMYTVPLGVENENAVLGSLEFMRGRSLPSIAMYFTEKPSIKFMEGAESASITGGEVPSEIPTFDLIIMNPPFTRATGRGGKEKGGLFGFILDKSAREEILKKYDVLREQVGRTLRDLAKNTEHHKMLSNLQVTRELYNIGQAGEGLLFLYLASKLINDGGKIAFVLPKSLLTGVSWFLARNLLVQRFHLEHIVVSYDAENGYNFSESTSLSEVLIVARKREKPEEDEQTTITLLIRKPATSLVARALALRIISEKNACIEVDGASAYVYRVSRKELVDKLINWGALVAFPVPELTKTSRDILSGNILGKSIPIRRLGEIVKIGIDAHQFHDAFNVVREKIPGS